MHATLPRAGTAGLNVPMFIALRRFTLLFTILLERYWLKKTHDWPTLSAMAIMIGGGWPGEGQDGSRRVGSGAGRRDGRRRAATAAAGFSSRLLLEPSECLARARAQAR